MKTNDDMITQGPSYFDSSGIAHKTLEEAQIAELTLLLNAPSVCDLNVSRLIVDQKDSILDILQWPRKKLGRPKARRNRVAQAISALNDLPTPKAS